MPLGSLLVRCSCVVNDRDECVTVLPDVENHISLHIVGILEYVRTSMKLCHRTPLTISVDLVTVKELLGRSSISVTMRCAHTNIESKRAGVEKLEGFGDNLVTVRPNARKTRGVLSLNLAPSYNVSKS
jgi:hypothetical protein